MIPLEPEIVTNIYVKNGNHVNAEDVLLALNLIGTAVDAAGAGVRPRSCKRRNVTQRGGAWRSFC